MKKILFLLILLLTPFIVKAEGKIEITKVELIDKGENVEVNSEPTFEGLTINFDLKFTALADIIHYKVTINNSTDKDYEIATGTVFSEGEYIKYEFGFNGDTSTIKAGEEKNLTIGISYVKEVPLEKYVNGKYNENNSMTLDLATEGGSHGAVDPIETQIPEKQPEEPQPATGAKEVILFISVLLILLLVITAIRKKNAFFLMPILLIPVAIYAAEKITINIETKIEIPATETVFKITDYHCGIGEPQTYEIEFMNSMKWSEFKNSEYFAKAKTKYDFDDNYLNSLIDSKGTLYLYGYNDCMADVVKPDVPEDESNPDYAALWQAYRDKKDYCEGTFINPLVKDSDFIIHKSNGEYRYRENCPT